MEQECIETENTSLILDTSYSRGYKKVGGQKNLGPRNHLFGKWNVVFFYPKDDSPGCTIESCHFRDNYKSFIENGIVLYGVSTDSIDSHKKFKQKHNLQYSLLSDAGAVLIKKLNLKKNIQYN